MGVASISGARGRTFGAVVEDPSLYSRRSLGLTTDCDRDGSEARCSGARTREGAVETCETARQLKVAAGCGGRAGPEPPGRIARGGEAAELPGRPGRAERGDDQRRGPDVPDDVAAGGRGSVESW